MLPRFFRFFRADALPNSGSVARDLLAAERTFLAWSRTGLGFIALGVALEKVDALAALAPALLHSEGSRTRNAAGFLIASGAGFAVYGTRRYFASLDLLKQGKFKPNAAGITGTAIVTVGIAVAGALSVVESSKTDASQDQQLGKPSP